MNTIHIQISSGRTLPLRTFLVLTTVKIASNLHSQHQGDNLPTVSPSEPHRLPREENAPL